ncbi:hypothetical protein [Tistrella sp.]|uniref:hypothetical protein n=1 Tax=Tistrella sp. TaxID=2024861 RepID=UPI0025FAD0DF|nr:hypothetical protein [Tistrella sp.]
MVMTDILVGHVEGLRGLQQLVEHASHGEQAAMATLAKALQEHGILHAIDLTTVTYHPPSSWACVRGQFLQPMASLAASCDDAGDLLVTLLRDYLDWHRVADAGHVPHGKRLHIPPLLQAASEMTLLSRIMDAAHKHDEAASAKIIAHHPFTGGKK